MLQVSHSRERVEELLAQNVQGSHMKIAFSNNEFKELFAFQHIIWYLLGRVAQWVKSFVSGLEGRYFQPLHFNWRGIQPLYDALSDRRVEYETNVLTKVGSETNFSTTAQSWLNTDLHIYKYKRIQISDFLLKKECFWKNFVRSIAPDYTNSCAEIKIGLVTLSELNLPAWRN